MNRDNGVRLLVAIVTIAMVSAVVAAIVVLGPPGEQRQLRFDARRASDLESIEQAIGVYAAQRGALPVDLAALSQEPLSRISRFDPETRAPYEYAIAGATSYTLCADFHAASPETASVHIGFQGQGWNHRAGRQCFERTQKIGKD